MDKALVLLGPTASGKSALSLKLAERLKIEIISLDSALVYKGMDIGTAKPTKEELSSVPHHLIGIIDPKDSYSAAQFREDCVRLVSEICSRGALPVICGGTMMYYKALCGGLSDIPPTTPEVREKIAQKAKESGWPKLHESLKTIDPLLFARLSPNDGQRISRALEVYEMTGRPLSSYYALKKDDCPFRRREVLLLATEDRAALRVQIRKRFMKMLEDGLIDEVKALKDRGDLSLSLPSMRCVGYRQVWEYLDGVYSYEEMIERSVIATAHLAKHQMTWLRGALKQSDADTPRLGIPIGDPDRVEKTVAEAQLLLQGA